MCSSPSQPRIWGIVPAAGLSRRFGHPKQILPFRGSTVVGTVVRTALNADVSGLVVVTRTQLVPDLQLPAEPRLRVAINDDDRSSMIDSIRIGLSAIEEFKPQDRDGVLVLPADMPAVGKRSCELCMTAYVNDPRRIVIATHGGRRGHPLIFPFSMRRIVGELTAGLNALPQRYPARVLAVEVDDPGVNLDLDTPEDWGEICEAGPER